MKSKIEKRNEELKNHNNELKRIMMYYASTFFYIIPKTRKTLKTTLIKWPEILRANPKSPTWLTGIAFVAALFSWSHVNINELTNMKQDERNFQMKLLLEVLFQPLSYAFGGALLWVGSYLL